ncbi:MAG TPA: peptide chain release factor N(5)-glutamine methyltransferase [Micrococcales bacterium]|uniref:peptide chain release factor N(5)-glutamine methyltransferase n=1 Tax=Miniimonas arenae TaxID=676201 RepID=UPI000EEFE29A|nr:peptide chain release factor N(5)-glutamine methyltransferase [Miniimonas arenae]HCX83605.1 peptide chain release factor N(5)-glutamine methyltransferase [Micrococcales bacterium]
MTHERPTASLREYVAGATALLAEAGVPSPGHDARALAAHALGRDRLEYLVGVDLPDTFAAAFAELVERRRRREPLQHLLGRTTFRHLDLLVRPGVFAPRPETEVVAQHAIDAAREVARAGRAPVVVDLCCGAGGIALALATEVERVRVLAVDASPEAVALTRANAERVGADLEVLLGDVRDVELLAALDGAVDVLVANPPYIPPDAVPVDPEVRDHDPQLALYGGGADGLEVPRAVVRGAVRLLRPAGVFVMEHAEVQAAAARQAALAAGLREVTSFDDLTGRPRGVRAVR